MKSQSEKLNFEDYREQQKNAYIEKSMAIIKEYQKKNQVLTNEKLAFKQSEGFETLTGIVLKPDRLVPNAEIKEMATKKRFIRIDAIDKQVTSDDSKNWFTIAILCMVTMQKTSKSKQVYRMWGFTSLIKNTQEMADKRSRNGYRVMNVLLYNEAAKAIDGNPGEVYAIINPLMMPKTPEYECALRVTFKSQLLKIGNAVNFGYCNHTSQVNGTPCRNFINTSVERHCHLHNATKVVQPKKPPNKPAESKAIYSPVKSIPKEHKLPSLKDLSPEEVKKVKTRYDSWKASESTKFDVFMKRRSTSKKCSNQLNRILDREELQKLEKRSVSKSQVIEIEVPKIECPDDKFISGLLNKRKQVFSDKFNGEADVKQNYKRVIKY